MPRRGVLGTIHGKGKAIVPVVEPGLDLAIEVVAIDTDRFGTFTRERPRVQGPLETVRAKARAALDAAGDARVGIASEGSFGPHPAIPFVARGEELVLCLDDEHGLELVGRDVTFETNFGAREVETLEEARAFAERALFPSHALVVMGPGGSELVAKGVAAPDELDAVLTPVLRSHGRAWIETDMRAHLNPTRMRSIERAAKDLVTVAKSRCPRCDRPGFTVHARAPGLPCGDCGRPTRRVLAETLRCVGCGEEAVRELEGTASPHECDACNP